MTAAAAAAQVEEAAAQVEEAAAEEEGAAEEAETTLVAPETILKRTLTATPDMPSPLRIIAMLSFGARM